MLLKRSRRPKKSNSSQLLQLSRRSKVRKTDLGPRDRVSKGPLLPKDSICSLRMKYLSIIRAKKKFNLLAKKSMPL